MPPHRRGAPDTPRTGELRKQTVSHRAERLAVPPCSCWTRGGGSRFSVYRDGHAVTRSELTRSELTRSELTRSASLLGSVGQLCAAFFHVEPTPEDGIAEVCLCAAEGGAVCPRKTVVCVARVQQRDGQDTCAWHDTYVARYSNCFQGGTEANLHAERFLVQDSQLERALTALPSDATCRLLLYMTYQPCHHSGGHRRRGMGTHGTSCTEALLAYARSALHPRGIALQLRIAYLYRAHWEEGAFDPKYQPAVEAARKGLQLLAQGGVELCALTHADWEWLVTQCDPDVQRAWREARPPFQPVHRQLRAQLDDFVAAALEAYAADSAPAACEPIELQLEEPCQPCDPACDGRLVGQAAASGSAGPIHDSRPEGDPSVGACYDPADDAGATIVLVASHGTREGDPRAEVRSHVLQRERG